MENYLSRRATGKASEYCSAIYFLHRAFVAAQGWLSMQRGCLCNDCEHGRRGQTGAPSAVPCRRLTDEERLRLLQEQDQVARISTLVTYTSHVTKWTVCGQFCA